MELSFERVVAQLESSAQKLESFAADATSILKKWSELPIDSKRRERERERHVDPSTGSNGSKADVFWSLYMDRDKGGKRRTVRGREGASPTLRGSLRVPGREADDGFSEKSSEAVVKVMSIPTNDSKQSKPKDM